jgi:hypothetical protein
MPYLDHRGYLRAYDPRHGKACPVHHTVMERHVGRILSSDEHVHHINGDPKDNRIENLQLMTAQEHIDLHASPWVEITCPNYGLTRKVRQIQVMDYVHDACNDCRFIFQSRTIRARNGLRYFWFLWLTGELVGPFETLKESIDNGPVVATKKHRTLIVCSLETGEVRPTTNRRDLPDFIIEQVRAALAGKGKVTGDGSK